MNILLNQISKKQRAALYGRVSSSKQSEEKTIESQISSLVEYASQNDLEIPEGWIFQDEGISGSTIQRPALDKLRDLIASGAPDVILIYHPDRLARKYVYQVLLLEEFSKCGVQVIFLKNKRAETPEEQLLEQFLGVFAEYERAQITERCRRGRLHKAKQGSLSVLPNAPYGYRYVSDKEKRIAYYELHPEESKTVLRLFEMFGLEGKSITELASYMDLSGKQARRSVYGWDRATIRRMLQNRTYTGLAGFSKTEKHTGDSQRIVRSSKAGRIQVSKYARRNCPEEDWISIQVPCIVSDTLYRIVQDKLAESQKFAARNTRKPSILQGIVVCGKCGGSYYKKCRTNGYNYYHCNHSSGKRKTCSNRSVRQKDLDDYVWDWVLCMLCTPTLIAEEIKRRVAEDPDKLRLSERKMVLQRETKSLTTSRNKLLEAYTETDCLSLEEFRKRMDNLNQRAKQVDKELSLIESYSFNEERIKQSQLTLERFAERLNNSSTELTIEEKQNVIRSLIDEIVIEEDSIKIKHCIPVASENRQNCPLERQRSFMASPLYSSIKEKMYPGAKVLFFYYA